MSDPVQSMVDGMNLVADAMDDARKAIVKEREDAAMGIPSVSPERADFDADMEPPDEPEYYAPLKNAPLSALYRTAGEFTTDDDMAAGLLAHYLKDFLVAVDVSEVELTREEYAAYSEARRPCDGE